MESAVWVVDEAAGRFGRDAGPFSGRFASLEKFLVCAVSVERSDWLDSPVSMSVSWSMDVDIDVDMDVVMAWSAIRSVRSILFKSCCVSASSLKASK